MNYLTPNFTLDELIASQTAARMGIDNIPSQAMQKNLLLLAQTLELVRNLLGAPIIVSSGYRSLELNKLIGGTKSSAHCYGLAADFTAPKFGAPLQICKIIAASNIIFDQLIFEGSWVHIGLASSSKPSRREVLSAKFIKGKANYQRWENE